MSENFPGGQGDRGTESGFRVENARGDIVRTPHQLRGKEPGWEFSVGRRGSLFRSLKSHDAAAHFVDLSKTVPLKRGGYSIFDPNREKLLVIYTDSTGKKVMNEMAAADVTLILKQETGDVFGFID